MVMAKSGVTRYVYSKSELEKRRIRAKLFRFVILYKSFYVRRLVCEIDCVCKS